MTPHQSEVLTGSPWGPLSPELPGIPGLPWKHTVMGQSFICVITEKNCFLLILLIIFVCLFVITNTMSGSNPCWNADTVDSIAKTGRNAVFRSPHFAAKLRQDRLIHHWQRHEGSWSVLSASINVPKCNEILMVFVSTDNYLQDKLVSMLSIINTQITIAPSLWVEMTQRDLEQQNKVFKCQTVINND